MAKKNEKESQELATQGTTAIGAVDYGSDMVDVGQMAPGYEGQTNEDTAIPFITLLQSNSPVVAEGKVEGAAAGNYMNTVTQQLWKNPGGLDIVVAATRHEYLRYTPRDAGGGFKGRYEITDPVVAKAKAESKEFGKYRVEDDELVETFSLFCISPGGMAIIPFKGTGIKAYKNWMTQVRAHTIDTPTGKKMPPLFAHLGKLTSVFEKNEKGTFWKPLISPANGSIANSLIAPDDDRFLLAKSLKSMLDSGVAKVNYDQEREAGGDGLPHGADGKPLF